MTTTAYFHDIKVLCRLHEGPLGAHIDLYAERLLKEGHCYQSGARCIRVVGDFSHWLARKRLDVSDVDEHTIEQYCCFQVYLTAHSPSYFFGLENVIPTLITPVPQNWKME